MSAPSDKELYPGAVMPKWCGWTPVNRPGESEEEFEFDYPEDCTESEVKGSEFAEEDYTGELKIEEEDVKAEEAITALTEAPIDDLYFDHDNFLDYVKGMPVQEITARWNKRAINSSEDLANGTVDREERTSKRMKVKESSGKEETSTATDLPKQVPKANGITRNNTPKPETAQIQPIASEPFSKQSWTPNEEAWLMLVHLKIKAMLEAGSNVTCPGPKALKDAFNNFFEGKVIQGHGGRDLPARKAREINSINRKIWSDGQSDLKELRTVIKKLREGRGDKGKLKAIPSITEDELQTYIEDGTVDVGSPD